MQIDDSQWSYNEFLAFLLIYGAEMTETSQSLTNEEISYIRERTGIADIDKIKDKVDSATDVQAIEILEDYRTKYLDTDDKKKKVHHDLEDLLKANHTNSQLEQVVIHILERLI